MSDRKDSKEIRHLKFLIEEKLGERVLSNAEAERLSDLTKHKISPDTFRRLFGLIKTTSAPAKSTLDIIVKEILEFEDWKDFKDSVNSWEVFNQWNQLTYDKEWKEDDIVQLRSRLLEYKNEQAIGVYITQLGLLVRTRPVKDWLPWIGGTTWTDSRLPRGFKLFLLNVLAEDVRNRFSTESAVKELLEYEEARKWVTHYFVDYGTLNEGYMANVLKALYDSGDRGVFVTNLLALRSLFAGDKSSAVGYSRECLQNQNRTNDYPILRSRYLACMVIDLWAKDSKALPRFRDQFNTETEAAKNLAERQDTDKKTQGELYMVAMEVVPVLLYLGYYEMVSWIWNEFPDIRFSRLYWNSSQDIAMIELCYWIAEAAQGSPESTSEYRSKIEQFDCTTFYVAYRDYVQAIKLHGLRLLGERSESSNGFFRPDLF